MNTRRIEGPTPNGGKYAVLYFYDENDKPVKEDDAVKAIGVEFDENNNRIHESVFIMKKKSEEKIVEKDDFEDTMEIPRIR